MDQFGASSRPSFGQNEVASEDQSATMSWVSHLQSIDPATLPAAPVYEGFVPAPDPFGAEFRVAGPDRELAQNQDEHHPADEEGIEENILESDGEVIDTVELSASDPASPGSEDDVPTPYSLDDDESGDLSESPDQGSAVAADDVTFAQPLQHYKTRVPVRPGKKRRKGERGGWSRGIKMGPLAPIRPSAEFTQTFQRAMHAYNFDNDLDTAHELVLQAISMNPEVFNAHILLSDIWFAREDSLNAVQALWTGAHCYSRDPFVWHRVVEACLEKATYERIIALNQAKYALRAILKISRNDHEARFRLAQVERESGQFKKALDLLNQILRHMPHNTDALGLYAEICIDMQKNEVAINRYKEAIQYYQTVGNTQDDSLEWADVLMYVKLLSLREGDREEVLASSIKVLKKLSRWLLGRSAERFWDHFEDDDREYDADDFPRRTSVKHFQAGFYSADQYGIGLPLQIRTQLGILRLRQGDSREEALSHFDWLNPDDVSEDANAVRFAGEFLEVATALNDSKEYVEAHRYFEALLRVDEVKESDFWIGIGTSAYILGHKDRSMEHFQSALACDPDSIVAKTYISKILAEAGQKLQAIKYACEAVEEAADRAPPMAAGVRRYERFEDRAIREAAEVALKSAMKMPGPNPSKKRQGIVRPDGTVLNAFELIKPRKPLAKSKGQGMSKRAPRPPTPTEDKPTKLDDIRPLYNTLLKNHDAMKSDDHVGTRVWMNCAKSMINDFRSNELFYPPMKHMQFQGYNKDAIKAQRRPLREKSGSMPATPQAQSSFGDVADQPVPSVEPQTNSFTPPPDYRDIPFTTWLDIFLQYAIICPRLPLAEFPNTRRDAYNIITSAIQCVIWWHDPAAQFQIHTCYLATTLAFNDQIALFGTVLPWFVKEFPFNTDAYRLFNAMHSVFPYSPHALGKAGQMENAYIAKSFKPKALLFRHLSSLDHHLAPGYVDPITSQPVPEFMRRSRDENFNPHTTDPITGQQVPLRPQEMDLVLLVLYGQLLFAKGQFVSALAYFHRAHALRPQEPLILLTMALCYLQQPLKPSFKAQPTVTVPTNNGPSAATPVRAAATAMATRHNFILQGLAFFSAYAEARLSQAAEHESRGWVGIVAETESEVRFNRARVWAMLGMGDLAVRGYAGLLNDGVLGLGGHENGMGDDAMETERKAEMDMQTAYALATTYALNGDVQSAKRITERYLVVE